MIFLITEIYMIIIMLISLLIMSLKKENIKNLNMLILVYLVVSLILLNDSKIDTDVIVFFFNYNIKIDYLTLVIKFIIIIFMINYFIIIKNYLIYEKIYIKELILIFWILIIGVFFLIMSNEFFMIYLALELQNLILYTLTNLRRWRSKSIESGIKYYVMGSFSSGLLLYGIIMLFGFFGTLDFVEIAYLIKDTIFFNVEINYIIYICSFILIGLLFKLGVAPFHWWVPEIYEGAPVIITLFFSIIPKLSLLVILYKLYIYIFIYFSFYFSFFFFSVTIITLVIGFLFSLYQKKIIKFLAYSSIFNTGFFMACFTNGTFLSLISILYFFLPYMFIILGIFFVIIIFRKIKNEKINLLWDFSLIANSNVILGFLFALLFFSLAGIPPLSGFWGKFFILLSLFLNKFYFLFFILIMFGIFSSFYYFRIIRFLFFTSKIDYIFFKSTYSLNLLVIYVLITLFFFIFFDYIFFFFFNILLYFTLL